MNGDWQWLQLTTHQDHVVAHVLGATLLAYFVFDETIYLLLDIGFIWSLYLDGQMVLLPHPVAIAELALNQESKTEIGREVEALLGAAAVSEFKWLKRPANDCVISNVLAYAKDDRRRFVLVGETGSLTIETSLGNGEILVTGY